MFAFTDVKPTTTGASTQMDVSYSDWLSTVFNQGISDAWTSLGWALYRNREDKAYRDWGEDISADLANKLYGIPDGPLPIKYTQDVNAQQAARDYERRRAELNRLHIISSATHSGFSARGLGTLTATLAASMAHPIDLAAAFFPAVGSAEKAAALAKTGAAAWRVALLRGLLTSEERLATLKLIGKFPRLSASVMDAAIGEAVYQIPNVVRGVMESGTLDTLNQYAEQVGMAGAFGGILRIGIENLARGLGLARDLYLRMYDREKDAAFRMAFNSQLQEGMIRADEIASMSEETLLRKAEFDMAKAQEKAQSDVAGPEVQSEIQRAAEARLTVHGSLGEINEKNLRSLVEDILRRGVGTATEATPEFKLLQELYNRYKAAVSITAKPKPGQFAEILSTIAELLGLTHNAAAKTMPDFYAEMIQGQKVEIPKKDIPEAPEIATVADAAQARVQSATRIATLQMRLEMAKTPEAKAAIEAELSQLMGLRTAASRGGGGAFVSPEERAAIVSMRKARNAEELARLVEEERKIRLQGALDRYRKEALDMGRTKALLELQREGRLVSPEVLNRYQTKETLSEEDIAIFENDARLLQENLNIAPNHIDNALEGKADVRAEDEFNATAPEKGIPQVDFEALRKAAEPYKLEDLVNKIDEAYQCVRKRIV